MATLLAPSRADRAFERLYRRHVADVYRYVLAVLQNQADAEDATQTAFLSAYRAYERGERPQRPLNWLIAIAHNVCRQRFRESARRPRLVELQDNVPARPADDDAPKAEEIRRALGYLAFNQRAALVMRELQGHSYDEIAQILGLSTSAVETLLFRARRAMREQLEGGLSCGEAELALSKRADGELSFSERGPLRAHLRECPECAALERGQRFRRRAIRGVGVVPLPSSLATFFGSGAVGTGVGVGAKAAAVVVAGILGGGLAGDALKERQAEADEPRAAAPARSSLLEASGREPQVPIARLADVRKADSARRRSPARQRVEATPSTAAPAAAAASLSVPPPAEASPASPAPEIPAAPEAHAPGIAIPATPAVPGVPAFPAPQPPAVTPSLPVLTEPVLPDPALPVLPDLTLPKVELPKVELPKVELPALPGVKLSPGVLQP